MPRRSHEPATLGDIERFGRLLMVELLKTRSEAKTAELGRAIDNAVRRFKFEEPTDVEGLEQTEERTNP